MRSMACAALVVATSGCGYAGYDSRWGQSAAVQRQHAQDHAPALHGDGADVAEKNGKAKTMRVRAYVARAYTTQVTDVPATLRELFADANDVMEPALGVRLELEGIRTWELARDDELPKAMAALREADPGTDVEWVAGFVGSLSKATLSFHDLGYGDLPGRYVVLRAPSSAQEHDAMERAYAELKDDERRRVQKEHRKHRVAATFLHEIGHTLGGLHERSERNLMFPEYRCKMTTFGPETTEIMRGVLAERDGRAPGDQAQLLRDIVAGVKRAPAGIFFDDERTKLLPQLEERAAYYEAASRPSAPAPAVASSASVTTAGASASAAPPTEPPPKELSDPDQKRFDDVRQAVAKSDWVGAWDTLKPLVKAYPKVMAVQELRCTIATSVFRFEVARVECQPLMKLSTGTN